MPAMAPKERQRAYRLNTRMKQEGIAIDDLDEDDRDFLIDFNARKDAAATAAKLAASEEIVSTHTERRTVEAAQGEAAIQHPLADAALAREEGRRLDAIMQRVQSTLESAIKSNRETYQDSISLLKDACVVYKGMVDDLRTRTKDQDEAHVALLNAMRDHFVARSEAEAALIAMQAQAQAQNPPSEMQEMIEFMKSMKELGIVPKDFASKKSDQKTAASDQKAAQSTAAHRPADPDPIKAD